MKINADAVFTRVSRGLFLIPLLTAVVSMAPSRADQVRLYTNADLKALETSSDSKGKKAVTNADLKAPLPSQSRSLAGTGDADADWQSVYAFIDRERAYLAQTRGSELAHEKMLLEAARLEREMHDCYSHRYTYPWYPFFGHFGHLAEFSEPSNPYNSLRARGIKTASDAFRESVQDSQIRRANLP